MILTKMFQERGEFFQLDTLAGIDEQGGASEIAFASGIQLGKDGDQLDGKIIDAVEAHVFEGAENGAFAGAGESGEDDKLARVLARSRGGLHRGAAQLFTRR
jgi:hypothetical protein